MEFQTVLVANRGEIAIRIMRAAAELGARTVAVHVVDEARGGLPGAHVGAPPPRSRSTSTSCRPTSPRSSSATR